jgi:hypothetical protein
MLKLNKNNKTVAYPIPLTTTSGKIRVKEREFPNQYGIPVATRSKLFNQKHYIEWQIGYDVVSKEINDKKPTTLEDKQFVGANGKTKSLFELSEIIYHFVDWGIISKESLEGVRDFIKKTDSELLIDVNPDFPITRTDFIPKNLFGISFQKSDVSYPLLIHKFGKFEVIAEIIIREKQRAIGIQPMLYLCFPITELKTNIPLIGRIASPKEFADFVFDDTNIDILLEMLKIFGILSRNHKHDILEILKVILED